MKTVERNGESVQVKTLKGFELIDPESRTTRNNRVNCDFSVLRQKLTNCILKFLNDRFAVDGKMVEKIGAFCRLDPSGDLKEIRKSIARDVNEFEMEMEYSDLCRIPELQGLNLLMLLQYLANGSKTSDFPEVFAIIARIAVATPHSADVGRSISANNRLKTIFRSSFDIQSENKWLFIHFNLPPLENWNPRKAILEYLSRKERRQHQLTVEASENGQRKTTSQPYFKGIFNAATGKRSHDYENLDDELSIEQLVEMDIQMVKRARHRF